MTESIGGFPRPAVGLRVSSTTETATKEAAFDGAFATKE